MHVKKIPSKIGPRSAMVNDFYLTNQEALKTLHLKAPPSSYKFKRNFNKYFCKVPKCGANFRVAKARRMCVIDRKKVVINGWVCLGTSHYNPKLHQNVPTMKRGFCNALHLEHDLRKLTFQSESNAIAKAKAMLPQHNKETVKKRKTIVFKCACHEKCTARLRVLYKDPLNIILRGCVVHYGKPVEKVNGQAKIGQ